ncbi:hypothetical protein FOMPIDRAFT_1026228 [Fomitopsis schrenkii]|uniref:Uncharacterized protein n=1 Tax=Fomitopsis schrenkii TaxID=2126942 RepID=S8DP30_FOMSC|nr:hypothetical protein FOMPIDRAFT_1026228 [Fomitopsis schrenkii]
MFSLAFPSLQVLVECHPQRSEKMYRTCTQALPSRSRSPLTGTHTESFLHAKNRTGLVVAWVASGIPGR